MVARVLMPVPRSVGTLPGLADPL